MQRSKTELASHCEATAGLEFAYSSGTKSVPERREDWLPCSEAN